MTSILPNNILPNPSAQTLSIQSVPPLENGDRLTLPEFELRYNAMAQIKKAELIEGTVYMASPLRFEPHAEPHANLIIWLGNYKVATPGVRVGDNPTVRLDLENELQPDVVMLIDPAYGGNARLSPEGYIEGAPELVAEVAASSASIDLGDKQRAYRRNGIPEYIVWQIFEQKLDWFQLQGGEYVSLVADDQGIIRSRVFPGLWLAIAALLSGEMQTVLAVLQQGLNSPEHQAFQQQLNHHRSK